MRLACCSFLQVKVHPLPHPFDAQYMQYGEFRFSPDVINIRAEYWLRRVIAHELGHMRDHAQFRLTCGNHTEFVLVDRDYDEQERIADAACRSLGLSQIGPANRSRQSAFYCLAARSHCRTKAYGCLSQKAQESRSRYVRRAERAAP